MFFSKYSLKLVQVSFLAGLLVFFSACDKSKFAKIETDNDKVSYSIGYNFGSQIIKNTDELDVELIIAGLRDGMGGTAEKVTALERENVLRAFAQRKKNEAMEKRNRLGDENKVEGEKFLAENKEKEGVVTLESGLQYKVITEGTGKQPAETDTVRVHYRGTLIDGSVFDSSIDRGEPAQFPLNRVIPGWTEALQLMKEGGKWELYIPQELAYGERGSQTIGPFSTLIFEVELLEVVEGGSVPASPH